MGVMTARLIVAVGEIKPVKVPDVAVLAVQEDGFFVLFCFLPSYSDLLVPDNVPLSLERPCRPRGIRPNHGQGQFSHLSSE